jgi:hypothetical protein
MRNFSRGISQLESIEKLENEDNHVVAHRNHYQTRNSQVDKANQVDELEVMDPQVSKR